MTYIHCVTFIDFFFRRLSNLFNRCILLTISTSDFAIDVSISMTGEDFTVDGRLCSCVCSVESFQTCTSIGSCVLLTVSTSDFASNVSFSMTGEDFTADRRLCLCVCSVESVSHSKLSKSSCTSIGSCPLLFSVCSGVRFTVGMLVDADTSSDSSSPSSLYLRMVGNGKSISLSMHLF